jgi:hypothetical protein
LELQLLTTTKESSKEISQLRMKLFELEMSEFAAVSSITDQEESSLLNEALAMRSSQDYQDRPGSGSAQGTASTSRFPSIPLIGQSPSADRDGDTKGLLSRQRTKQSLDNAF